MRQIYAVWNRSIETNNGPSYVKQGKQVSVSEIIFKTFEKLGDNKLIDQRIKILKISQKVTVELPTNEPFLKTGRNGLQNCLSVAAIVLCYRCGQATKVCLFQPFKDA